MPATPEEERVKARGKARDTYKKAETAKELKKCAVKKQTYFVLGRLEMSRQNKNLLCQQDKPNEPTKEGSLLFVLFESPFTSVSKVSRGHAVIFIHFCEHFRLTLRPSAM